MRSKIRLICTVACLSGLLIGSCGLLVGCGGDEKPAVVKDEDLPQVKGKGSMDFYKDNMKTGKSKK